MRARTLQWPRAFDEQRVTAGGDVAKREVGAMRVEPADADPIRFPLIARETEPHAERRTIAVACDVKRDGRAGGRAGEQDHGGDDAKAQ